MDLRPTPSYMKSKVRENHPWWKVLAELIDNAIDAGAKRVTISCQRGELSVFDDGRGVRDIRSLAQLGNHDDAGRPKEKIGIYGVGAKEAWLSSGPRMHVLTVCDGRRTEYTFDLDELIENHWQTIEEPTSTEVDEASYTRLKFELWPSKGLPSVACQKKIAWLFSPAIQSGVKISFGGVSTLQAVALPALTDVVSDTFAVAGMNVTIEIGRCNGPVTNGPFWLEYCHRVIEATGIGTCQYGVSGIAGRIILAEEWKPLLGKNKDQLTEHIDELEQAIFSRIEPLLQEAAAESETFETQMILSDLEGVLNAFIGSQKKKGKSRRPGKPRSKPGTVLPVGSDRTTGQAAVVSGEGDVIEAEGTMPRRGMRMKYQQSDSPLMGRYDKSEVCVYLNDAHPAVAKAKEEGNRLALLQSAAAIIAEHESRFSEGQGLLSFAHDSVLEIQSQLMATVKEVENAVA